jgi:CheY-like chemotaxis protein
VITALTLLLALLPAQGPPSSLAEAPGGAETAGTELTTRAFVINHKDLDDVVSLIRPVLSEDSSVLIQSKIRTVTVTDGAEALERVAALIAGFDLPPHDVSITINLIKASRAGPGPRTNTRRFRLPPSLRRLTQWLDYELLGGMSILTTEAEDSSLILGEIYRIRFSMDLVDDRAGKIRLTSFVLERRGREPGEDEYVPIFDTAVNLRSGTPYVFGATRGENAQNALFLSVTASIVP